MKNKNLKKKEKTQFTFVLAHWHFGVTIGHAYECLTVLMVALMNYLNRCCCCCCYRVERIHRHCHLDVSMMGWVVDFDYLVILQNKNKTKTIYKSVAIKTKFYSNLDQKKEETESFYVDEVNFFEIDVRHRVWHTPRHK